MKYDHKWKSLRECSHLGSLHPWEPPLCPHWWYIHEPLYSLLAHCLYSLSAYHKTTLTVNNVISTNTEFHDKIVCKIVEFYSTKTCLPILAFLSTMAFLMWVSSPIPIGMSLPVPFMSLLSSSSGWWKHTDVWGRWRWKHAYGSWKRNDLLSSGYQREGRWKSWEGSYLVDIRAHDHWILYYCPVSNLCPQTNYCASNLTPLLLAIFQKK